MLVQKSRLYEKVRKMHDESVQRAQQKKMADIELTHAALISEIEHQIEHAAFEDRSTTARVFDEAERVVAHDMRLYFSWQGFRCDIYHPIDMTKAFLPEVADPTMYDKLQLSVSWS